MSRFWRGCALGAALAVSMGGPARAAEFLDVPTILPLTGSSAFTGDGSRNNLDALAASVNAPAATETVPAAVELVVGVNVAE